jgi:hypothetical protein
MIFLSLYIEYLKLKTRHLDHCYFEEIPRIRSDKVMLAHFGKNSYVSFDKYCTFHYIPCFLYSLRNDTHTCVSNCITLKANAMLTQTQPALAMLTVTEPAEGRSNVDLN